MKKLDLKPLKSDSSLYMLLICAALILWGFSFSGFLNGKLMLGDDASTYFEHIRFFTENLRDSIFPLWDPFVSNGVPSEFFLRRIGSYNPFYLAMAGLMKLGISFQYAYSWFIVSYFLLGILGFYFVTKEIFGKSFYGFLAALQLMFSSVVSNLFNSFLSLIFTPMIWFIYFSMRLSKNPKDYHLIGACFCLMLLATTYLPFYFLLIVCSLLVLMSCFYFSSVKAGFFTIVRFMKENRILSLMCLIVLFLSLAPGIQLYLSSLESDVVMPMRHDTSESTSQFSVGKQTMAMGGIGSIHLIFELISQLKTYQMGMFYVPVFLMVLLLFSFIVRLNKRLVILSVLIIGYYLLSLYGASPVYPFFFKFIFFFKMIRNFQFFLWLVILPCIIILAIEQLRLYLDERLENKNNKVFDAVWLIFIHGALILFLVLKHHVEILSYLVIASSCMMFLMLNFGLLKKNHRLVLVFLYLLIIVHPLRAFYYFNQNSIQRGEAQLTSFNRSKVQFSGEFSDEQISEQKVKEKPKPSYVQYVSTGYDHHLQQTINPDVLKKYLNYKFYLYDKVKYIADDQMDFQELAGFLYKGWNRVYVAKDVNEEVLEGTTVGVVSRYSTPIEGEQENFKVLNYNVNQLALHTNFNERKFLVFNEAYHRGWNLKINGKKQELYRANFAYQGFWLPSGSNQIVLTFGSTLLIYKNIFFIILFNSMLFIFLVRLFKQKRVGYET